MLLQYFEQPPKNREFYRERRVFGPRSAKDRRGHNRFGYVAKAIKYHRYGPRLPPPALMQRPPPPYPPPRCPRVNSLPATGPLLQPDAGAPRLCHRAACPETSPERVLLCALFRNDRFLFAVTFRREPRGSARLEFARLDRLGFPVSGPAAVYFFSHLLTDCGSRSIVPNRKQGCRGKKSYARLLAACSEFSRTQLPLS